MLLHFITGDKPAEGEDSSEAAPEGEAAAATEGESAAGGDDQTQPAADGEADVQQPQLHVEGSTLEVVAEGDEDEEAAAAEQEAAVEVSCSVMTYS